MCDLELIDTVAHLNRNLGEPQAVEVLCHEWAHAMAWHYSLDRLARTPRSGGRIRT